MKGHSLVLGSIYMPCDDNSKEHADDYEAAVGVMQGILDRHLGCNFVFGGDFNVEKQSMNINNQHVHNLCKKNNLMWLDHHVDCVDYTFNAVNLGVYSLIDHFICSRSIVDCSDSVIIQNDDDNLSDH